MADTDNLIGHGPCPLCGSEKAKIKFSGKGLAYMNCNACNIQIFCRSDNSDSRMRALVKKETAPAAVTPPPAPAPPAPETKTETKTTAPDKPKADGFRWGFLGAN